MSQADKVDPTPPAGSYAPAVVAFRTKEDYVADYLREGILSGRFPRGTHLKQGEIAEEIRLSITPVREAFRILEAEGYLASETHRGVIVAPFNVSATREITELRIVLETRLALLATKRMRAEDHAELAKLEREFEAAHAREDRAAVRAINYRFHKHLYSLAGQPQTLHFVQVLWAKYPFDLINRIGGRPGRAAAEHRQLLDALKRTDRKAVAASVRAHIDTGWRELQSDLDKLRAAAADVVGDRPRGPHARQPAKRGAKRAA
jgi:DNA-binding GntR family transcriptional regulator